MKSRRARAAHIGSRMGRFHYLKACFPSISIFYGDFFYDPMLGSHHLGRDVGVYEVSTSYPPTKAERRA